MSTKNLSRRQILASGAALAAPMLALTTPTHVHAAVDKCISNGSYLTFKQILAQIAWEKASIPKALGSKSSLRFGEQPARNVTFIEVTTKLTEAKTRVSYYYSKLSYSTGLPRVELYDLNSDTCMTGAPTVTLTKRRCLANDDNNNEIIANDDPDYWEDVGTTGTTSRPWILNRAASRTFTGNLRRDVATAAGSAQRYRQLFGWIDTIGTSSGGTRQQNRRIWAWDPLANVYRHVTYVVATNANANHVFRPVEQPAISTEDFNTFNGYTSQLINTLSSSSVMSFWDPVLLLGESMRYYGRSLDATAQGEQLAAISRLGSAGARTYTEAIVTYRNALGFLWRNGGVQWSPRDDSIPPTPPPGGYGTTKPGDNSTNPGGGSGSLNPPGGSGSSNPPASSCSA